MIILIADDDRLVRFTIKSMLAEILKAEYSVLEATNGREMVELCKINQPDIVFTDIKMPFMNGLEAVEEVKNDMKKTEFVIISGYSDFEYAKQGIHLGVSDYLLKPVEEEQLASVMVRLTEKLNRKQKQSNVEFRLKLFDMFNYFSTAGVTQNYVDFQLPEGFEYMVVGAFTGNRTEKEKSEIEKIIIEKVTETGAVVTQTGGYYAQIYSDEGNPYFVFGLSSEKKDYIISAIKRFKVLQKEKNAVMFFYFSCEKMEEIYRLSEKLDKEFFVGLNYPQGSILAQEDIKNDSVEFQILRLIYRLLSAWRAADSIQYKDVLNEIYRNYKDCAAGLNIDLRQVALHCSEIIGCPVDGSCFKGFCRSFIDISDTMYDNVSVEENDLIEKVKDYIQENYMKDISISQIAEQYHLTANYLSTIFHNKAECKFIDYLTDIRVSNAKRLLIKNATASVQDIAMMVGYSSARHFSTVFQKKTGITPTTYRKEKYITGGGENEK